MAFLGHSLTLVAADIIGSVSKLSINTAHVLGTSAKRADLFAIPERPLRCLYEIQAFSHTRIRFKAMVLSQLSSSACRSNLLKCFRIPDNKSMLLPGEKRENCPPSDPGDTESEEVV